MQLQYTRASKPIAEFSCPAEQVVKPISHDSVGAKRILSVMDRLSYPSLGSLRAARLAGSQPREYTHVVPFGPRGGGQWTGHAIGLFIVFGFVLMALVGVPESRLFFVTSLGLSAVLGCGLYLWHRSKSVF